MCKEIGFETSVPARSLEERAETRVNIEYLPYNYYEWQPEISGKDVTYNKGLKHVHRAKFEGYPSVRDLASFIVAGFQDNLPLEQIGLWHEITTQGLPMWTKNVQVVGNFKLALYSHNDGAEFVRGEGDSGHYLINPEMLEGKKTLLLIDDQTGDEYYPSNDERSKIMAEHFLGSQDFGKLPVMRVLDERQPIKFSWDLGRRHILMPLTVHYSNGIVCIGPYNSLAYAIGIRKKGPEDSV